jgi:predicted dehydrogenase
MSLVNDLMKNGIPNYVACNLRFLDSLVFIKKALSNERINEVNVYCGSYLPDWRPNTDYKKCYSANKELGGGVHLDLIHELDYTYWLFGQPMKSNGYFSEKSSLKINAFDYANYLWEYEGFNANIVLNYYRKKPKRNLEIVTEKNIYRVDLLDNKVFKNDKMIYQSNQIILDTYTSQMDYFISRILNDDETFNTVEEAYKILNLCLDY